MNNACQTRVTYPVLALAVALLLILGWVMPVNGQESEFSAEQLEFFERNVRPLLVDNCHSCHSLAAQENQGGLLLDSRAAILKGGDSGEAIVPGKPQESLLIGAVNYEDYEMPPKGQLSEDQIAILTKWIQTGAAWPAESEIANGAALEEFDLEARRKDHWVWQPVQNPTPPEVDSKRWSSSLIDQFIHAKHNAESVRPTEKADPLVVARRLHMDLTGLPPTVDELNEFKSDLDKGRESALENLVDRLLASPHFGERWGRHWMDLSRYADSYGHEFDNDIPNAFQYRDYIVRALNADIPYDQLVREHIAGDLLPEPRMNSEKQFNESILGTGFWFLGESTHSPVDIRKDESERFDNMIDVASKSFFGVTVSCARCHDHKFDAISTADYYSLTGFLQSSDYRQVRFESIEQNRKVAKELDEVDQRFQAEILALLSEFGATPPEQADGLDDDRVILDYATLPKSEYLQDGFSFGMQPKQAGNLYFQPGSETPVVATYSAAVNDPFWNGLRSVTEGFVQDKSLLTKIPRSGRTLRTPTYELESGKVSCLVSGAGHVVACVDSHRLVFGPLHKETIVSFKGGPRPKWVDLKLDRYVGHRLHLEFVPAEEKQISVRLIARDLNPNAKRKLGRELRQLDNGYSKFADKAQTLLSNSKGENVGLEADPDPEIGKQQIAAVVQRWQAERSRLSSMVVEKSRLAPAMIDGTGEDAPIYIRGNASKLGKIEPRHFLTAIDGGQALKIERGSGRLILAAKINDPSNPLTSRVIVNRIWHHLMGRGLVPTTDDFGVLGQRPTHPELLDHLAKGFIDDGQSIKRMIKRIVLTETYQMADRPNPKALASDPKNLQWHFRPPKRLEGEIIRDSLLALSGKLDKTMEGPPVPVHLTAFMEGRGRPEKSGPLDGSGRRSIYISVRRNFLSPFMTTFDTPAPFSTMGRRNVSNVPAQSLILMNDPFVFEQAQKWAERSIDEKEDFSDRIQWMYESAFGRVPTEAELKLSLEFVATKNDIETWTHFAHALINTKEFIFLR